MILMHRVILGVMPGVLVDHIDGNGLNNTRGNLRICTKQENMRNRPRNANNTSGYKGVNWRANRNKWRARIHDGVRDVFIGHFDSAEDAARAYNDAAKRLFGGFAFLNAV